MEILDEQLKQIQDVSEYRTAVKSIKTESGWVIFSGVLALLSGISGFGYDWLSYILCLMGIVLLITGIKVISNPTLKGLVTNGVLILIVGLWNIFFGIINTSPDPESDNIFIDIGGFIQIGVAIHHFMKYKKLSVRFPAKPPEEVIKSINVLIKTITKSKMKKSEDMIEFKAKPFFGRAKYLKGILLDDSAIFMAKTSMKRKHELFCARKEDVNITTRRKLILQRSYKAILQIGEKEMEGLISKKSLERYAAWKTIAEIPQDVETEVTREQQTDIEVWPEHGGIVNPNEGDEI